NLIFLKDTRVTRDKDKKKGIKQLQKVKKPALVVALQSAGLPVPYKNGH
ncbi:9643_t:CDS:2, partial [Acaulospora colombiana]